MTATIAAISTPQGMGGIGVIRISGPEAVTVAGRIFCAANGKSLADIPGYTAQYGKIFWAELFLGQP